MAMVRKDLEKCLTGKFGFEPIAKNDHDGYALFVGTQKVATTYFSRSTRLKDNISDKILGRMAVQLGVNTGVLKKMVGCTVSSEQYQQQLREQGQI